jgi:hypothetical protein
MSSKDGVLGTVYLLHFERPYRGRMQHYLGKPGSSGLLKVLWGVCGGEFAELTVVVRRGDLVEGVERPPHRRQLGADLRRPRPKPGGNSDAAGSYYCWPPKAAR